MRKFRFRNSIMETRLDPDNPEYRRVIPRVPRVSRADSRAIPSISYPLHANFSFPSFSYPRWHLVNGTRLPQVKILPIVEDGGFLQYGIYATLFARRLFNFAHGNGRRPISLSPFPFRASPRSKTLYSTIARTPITRGSCGRVMDLELSASCRPLKSYGILLLFRAGVINGPKRRDHR